MACALISANAVSGQEPTDREKNIVAVRMDPYAIIDAFLAEVPNAIAHMSQTASFDVFLSHNGKEKEGR